MKFSVVAVAVLAGIAFCPAAQAEDTFKCERISELINHGTSFHFQCMLKDSRLGWLWVRAGDAAAGGIEQKDNTLQATTALSLLGTIQSFVLLERLQPKSGATLEITVRKPAQPPSPGEPTSLNGITYELIQARLKP